MAPRALPCPQVGLALRLTQLRLSGCCSNLGVPAAPVTFLAKTVIVLLLYPHKKCVIFMLLQNT